MSGLRIALVATPVHPVPPLGYGPVERLVGLLASGLRARGHQVRVFAGATAGDGEPSVLTPALTAAADDRRWHEVCWDIFQARTYRSLCADPPQILHEHTNHGFVAADLARHLGRTRIVGTIHTTVSPAQAALLHQLQDRVHWVAVSHAQRATAPGAPFASVVPNAVDLDSLAPNPATHPDGYLLHLGRIHPEKGQHIAIEVAKRTGRRLILAGKVDGRAPEYFTQRVRPHLGGMVEWVPEATGARRAALLAGAHALLFPVQWEEPFGLAMAEAMASGTPVVATPRGAARELVIPGLTGEFGGDVPGLVAALDRLAGLDRQACARWARTRFHPDLMVDGYERIYTDVLDRATERTTR
jgi:glycosyltransferase involved in cell wall biosynthesis